MNGVHIQRSIYLISGPYERKRRRWIAFERKLTRTVAMGVRCFMHFFRFQPAVNTKVSRHLVKLEIQQIFAVESGILGLESGIHTVIFRELL